MKLFQAYDGGHDARFVLAETMSEALGLIVQHYLDRDGQVDTDGWEVKEVPMVTDRLSAALDNHGDEVEFYSVDLDVRTKEALKRRSTMKKRNGIWKVGDERDGYSFILCVASGRRRAIKAWKAHYAEARKEEIADEDTPEYKETLEEGPDVIELLGEVVALDDGGYKL
jgi:hypothetical protein